MTKAEKKKLDEMFWMAHEIIGVVQPELTSGITPDNVDISDLRMDTVLGMLDMIRVHSKYIVYDVESCRRELDSLKNIVKQKE